MIKDIMGDNDMKKKSKSNQKIKTRKSKSKMGKLLSKAFTGTDKNKAKARKHNRKAK